jgi:DNA mismatch endonuclease (patch repair protein)
MSEIMSWEGHKMDNVSKEKRSKIMAAIHSKNTNPEVDLREALSSKGLTFEVNYGPEKIDIAFVPQKVAVFVDGCFWHGCPIHSHDITTNAEYWKSKLSRNKERDLEKNQKLRCQGWIVLRFWEHELKDMEGVVERTTANLQIN